MPRLPLVVFLVLHWLAIGTGSVFAQTAGSCIEGKDRGTRTHATGNTHSYGYGYRYRVELDDNLTRIAERFCTTVWRLQQINGIPNSNKLPAGSELTILGLGPTPSQECSPPYLVVTTPQSSPPVGNTFAVSGMGCVNPQGYVEIFARDSAGQLAGSVRAQIIRSGASDGTYTFSTSLTVANVQGSTLWLTAYAGSATSTPIQVTYSGMPAACNPAAPLLIREPPPSRPLASFSFEVSGEAGFNCRVIVTASDINGNLLGEASTDSGASTQWRTLLTLRGNITNGAYIKLDAYNTQTGARDSKTFTFGSASGNYFRDLDPARCQLALRNATYSLTNPNGPRVRPLVSGSYVTARRVVLFEGQLWYAISAAFSGPDEWVLASDVGENPNCSL